MSKPVVFLFPLSLFLSLSLVPTTQPTWWRTWRAYTGQPDSRAKASASSSLTTRSRMSPSWSTWTMSFHLARSENSQNHFHSEPFGDVFRACAKISHAQGHHACPPIAERFKSAQGRPSLDKLQSSFCLIKTGINEICEARDASLYIRETDRFVKEKSSIDMRPGRWQQWLSSLVESIRHTKLTQELREGVNLTEAQERVERRMSLKAKRFIYIGIYWQKQGSDSTVYDMIYI